MGTGSRKLPREPVPGWGRSQTSTGACPGWGPLALRCLSPPGQAPPSPSGRTPPLGPGQHQAFLGPARGRSAPCGSGSGPDAVELAIQQLGQDVQDAGGDLALPGAVETDLGCRASAPANPAQAGATAPCRWKQGLLTCRLVGCMACAVRWPKPSARRSWRTTGGLAAGLVAAIAQRGAYGR